MTDKQLLWFCIISEPNVPYSRFPRFSLLLFSYYLIRTRAPSLKLARGPKWLTKTLTLRKIAVWRRFTDSVFILFDSEGQTAEAVARLHSSLFHLLVMFSNEKSIMNVQVSESTVSLWGVVTKQHAIACDFMPVWQSLVFYRVLAYFSFNRRVEKPWKPLNFKSPISRPWKYLKLILVLESPWFFIEENREILIL